MNVDVVIPHGRNDDEYRTRARAWVAERYQRVHGLPVTFAGCPTDEWCKADAVNPVVAASRADIVVIGDGDSYISDDALQSAIRGAQRYGWAMPHSTVRRINAEDSARIIAGETVDDPGLAHRAHSAVAGGGIVVVRRDAWFAVGGFDPRYKGWGGEDASLGAALATLIYHQRRSIHPVLPGPRGILWHLWHPPAPAWREPSHKTLYLYHRYQTASRNPDAMRALIEEVTCLTSWTPPNGLTGPVIVSPPSAATA